MATIPNGSLVLVTGVNGYIGSHIADQFLECGYRVRGTVRSECKGKPFKDFFDRKYGEGRFEVEIVGDMLVDGAFDNAVKGVSGISHVASILTFSSCPQLVITPLLTILHSLLQSATKTKSIKSFIYTSSSTAAYINTPNKAQTITKETWNDEAIEKAWDKEAKKDGYCVYAASKAEAEKALWKFVEERRPRFQVVSVLPNACLGEGVGGATGLGLGSTGEWVGMLWRGEGEKLMMHGPQYFINVRDTARLHVAGLLDPKQNKQRIFAFAYPFNFNDILAIFRKLYPNKKFIDDIPGLGRDLSIVPNGEAEMLLGKWFWRKEFAGLEETVRESLKGLEGAEVEVVEEEENLKGLEGAEVEVVEEEESLKDLVEDEGVGVEEDVGVGDQGVMEDTESSVLVVPEIQRGNRQSARISWRGTVQQSKRDGEPTTSGRNLRGLIAEARMAGNMDERWMLRRLV